MQIFNLAFLRIIILKIRVNCINMLRQKTRFSINAIFKQLSRKEAQLLNNVMW